MSKKKKIVVLSVMVSLLVVSGILNFVVSNDTVPTKNVDEGVSVSAMFSAYRADIEDTRNQMMLELQSIIDSSNTSAEAKASAEKILLNTCENMETESILEALIKAKGFSDTIVSVNNTGVDVVVRSNELSTSQLAQILNLVVDKTGVTTSMVHIQPYA